MRLMRLLGMAQKGDKLDTGPDLSSLVSGAEPLFYNLRCDHVYGGERRMRDVEMGAKTVRVLIGERGDPDVLFFSADDGGRFGIAHQRSGALTVRNLSGEPRVSAQEAARRLAEFVVFDAERRGLSPSL